jgi:DNA polymerase
MGYHVVAHIHDEMIIGVPRADEAAFAKIDGLMAEPIDWAPGLPLKGGTYACGSYQKD